MLYSTTTGCRTGWTWWWCWQWTHLGRLYCRECIVEHLLTKTRVQLMPMHPIPSEFLQVLGFFPLMTHSLSYLNSFLRYIITSHQELKYKREAFDAKERKKEVGCCWGGVQAVKGLEVMMMPLAVTPAFQKFHCFLSSLQHRLQQLKLCQNHHFVSWWPLWTNRDQTQTTRMRRGWHREFLMRRIKIN